MELNVSLEEAFSGFTRSIEVGPNYNVCEACQGEGSESVICDTCKGLGEVLMTQEWIFGLRKTSSVQRCIKCRGTGRIVKKKNKCKICSGKGILKRKEKVEITVPCGIDSNQMIRIKHKGLLGKTLESQYRGDLCLFVCVNEHALFQRDGQNLFATINIDPVMARDGGKLEVQTIDGKVKVNIKAGTENGTILRLKNRGMPDLGDNKIHGDYYLKIKVD